MDHEGAGSGRRLAAAGRAVGEDGAAAAAAAEHPLGCHSPRVPDRAAMDAIFFVLRTGCRWTASRATGICSSTSAHRRFQEWTQAGAFEAFWREGLLAYDMASG